MKENTLLSKIADMTVPLDAVLLGVGSAVILFIIVVLLLLKKIKKSEEIKKEFIAVASHRLRTPLTQMQWMLSGLNDDIATVQGKDLVANMETTLKDLTMVVNKFLDASEAGKSSLFYDYIYTDTSIMVVIRQVIADYSVGISAKNITLTVRIDDNLPKLFIDADRIAIAFGAVLENAIIYTKKGGTIDVYLRTEGDFVVCSVKDSGIGIAKKAFAYVFSKFYRTKEAVSWDRDRAGLGLFIAEQIIKKHKGKITVNSEGRDKGSVFTFSLPLKR